MTHVRDTLIAITTRWWAVLLTTLLNAAAFAILFGLEDRFEALTGMPVFDTQNGLSPAMIQAQLPLYTGAALDAYLRFAAFDFLFPLVAATFLAVLWTLLLRWNQSLVARRLLRGGLPLVAFLATVCDWMENISLLTLIWLGGTAPSWVVQAAIVWKQLKLATLFFTGPITAALLALLVWHLATRFWQRAQERAV